MDVSIVKGKKVTRRSKQELKEGSPRREARIAEISRFKAHTAWRLRKTVQQNFR